MSFKKLIQSQKRWDGVVKVAQTKRSALVYCLDEAVVSAVGSKFISRALGVFSTSKTFY